MIMMKKNLRVNEINLLDDSNNNNNKIQLMKTHRHTDINIEINKPTT